MFDLVQESMRGCLRLVIPICDCFGLAGGPDFWDYSISLTRRWGMFDTAWISSGPVNDSV